MSINLNNILKRIEIIPLIFLLITYSCIFSSCANQLPPSGGEDDKNPPGIKYLSPAPGSVNFKEKEINFEFDKYIDRRSFEESFLISPKPDGKMEFDWSGKKVKVIFEKPLSKNKTYKVTIGTDLKDVNAGNKLKNPVQFAFSTGNEIDNHKIIGRVYVKTISYIVIFAYEVKNREKINPENEKPDYFSILNSDGTFNLTNIPAGKYRLFAVKDNDKNFRYDKGFEDIAVTDRDVEVKDTSDIQTADFLMINFDFSNTDNKFLESFNTDSLKVVYHSIKNGSVSIPVDYKYYFHFKFAGLSKYEIASGISLTDTIQKRDEKLVYNWITDSLVEVFPSQNLNYATAYKFIVDLKSGSKKYYSEILFTTVERKKYSKLSGKISGNVGNDFPIGVFLYNNEDASINYSLTLKNDSVFTFPNVIAGDYYLFAFVDKNSSNIFQKGNYDPFVTGEKFYLSEKLLNVKGRMDYENIYINFK